MSQDTTPEEGQLILGIKEAQSFVAPAGKVDIHIGIVNKGANEEYVDIQVNGVPSDWISLDTPVVHLGPREAKQVILTIQAPPTPQSRAGQYPLDVRAVSQSDPKRSAVARSSLTVAAFQTEGRIGIILSSIHFSVVPGSSVTIPVLLQNLGLKEDTFQLNIEGVPANWITTNALFTKLEPSASKEIEFTIGVPRTPQAGVGRTPIKIIIISQDYPDQKAEADCILTVAAFSQFSATLQPTTVRAGQTCQLDINNEGNTVNTYSLGFQNPAGVLIFEKEVPVSRSGSQLIEKGYFEIPQGEKVQVEPGGQGVYSFRTRVMPRPLFGRERTYPFTVEVLSAENTSLELPGETSEKGFIPRWVAASFVIGSLLFCLLLLVPLYSLYNRQASASVTQTAVSFEQTQAALDGSSREDTDGDGLINSDELKIGTDPLNPDTDGDGLTDGQEFLTLLTNPLVADSDKDGLSDGQEVQTYKTNPLSPDTDGDLLSDGDEVNRKTDPLNPDTDKDGLSDGVEINIGTDPLQPDTDKDGLLDGQENQTCPRQLNPDSDGDGILDGRDLDPCNPNNPALTATAITAALTQSPQASMLPPTQTSQATVAPPTNSPTGTPAPTGTAGVGPTPTVNLPAVQGIMLFASNRDGNSEIYAENLSSQSLLRLTNNPAVDMQPAIAADGLRVVYVSNQNGNNEIYLTGIDRRPPVNLTNNPADDQQPVWSPDGNWIAFTSNRDGNQEIYIMRSSDGSEVRNLTSNSGSDFAPTWFSIPHFLGLSTENWIVFTSNRDGNQEIYKVTPDGTGLTNLTRNPANDHSPTSFVGGTLLAFVSDRDGNPEIYTITTDGGSPTNISNNSSQDLDPTFDPSGRWVAFSSDREGNLDIFLVEVTGGLTYNLTRNPAQDVSPDW